MERSLRWRHMSVMASQIISNSTIFFNSLFKLTTKETIKFCIIGPLWRESHDGYQWFLLIRASGTNGSSIYTIYGYTFQLIILTKPLICLKYWMLSNLYIPCKIVRLSPIFDIYLANRPKSMKCQVFMIYFLLMAKWSKFVSICARF